MTKSWKVSNLKWVAKCLFSASIRAMGGFYSVSIFLVCVTIFYLLSYIHLPFYFSCFFLNEYSNLVWLCDVFFFRNANEYFERKIEDKSIL